MKHTLTTDENETIEVETGLALNGCGCCKRDVKGIGYATLSVREEPRFHKVAICFDCLVEHAPSLLPDFEQDC